MDRETERKLRVFSQELNYLLNFFHESSKTQKRLSRTLAFKNTLIYVLQIILKAFSWKGLSLAFVPVSIAAIFREGLKAIVNLPPSALLLIATAVTLLTGAFLRSLVLEEMSRVGSPFFHLGIYEKRRKEEYNSLIALSEEKNFVLTLKEELMKANSEDQTLKNLRSEIAKQEEVIKKNEEAILDLLDKLTASEELANVFNERSDMAMDFLFRLKNKLSMLVHDQFNLDNISFGVNYSLYKVKDTGLRFIDGYGINKAEFEAFIPFQFLGDKYIQSIHTTHQHPLILRDFISWKRTLQDGEEWIISLHLDASNRIKYSLETDAGKLNLSLIQELLWICCELLNKFAKKRQKTEE
ncbi:hypothetical protein CR194_18940 [Salipaludibacillus keqinensis]|uniref:Uncharacterized protein n=1 Tax=Salipaludibacillus keqinensis TaxID=2045207 RepID=A0A323T5G7_9BACI|nr:hypothetical protein [Salipaludibacillus keqinensis]PYZ91702.1 hypothetical protein CR194_18940 [Salipaludibacillus keqinensis]